MNKNRIAYIDHIKVFLTFMVVAHHAGQAYGHTGGMWPVDDPTKVDFLSSFFFLNASYMMGFYFFISGYFMTISLKRKNNYMFIKDRLLRIGVPLVFFSLLVFLPVNYLMSGSDQNIIDFFIHSYLHQSPVSVWHLWFLASLLVYNLVYILLIKPLVKNIKFKSIKFNVLTPLVYIIFLAIVSFAVRLKYPIDRWETWVVPIEVAHLPQYFSLFLLGVVFNLKNWLEQIKLKTCLFYLLGAIIAFIFYKSHIIRINLLLQNIIESFMCVGFCLGLIGLFRKYLNKGHHIWQLISENAYGIYIFHLFIVIALQFLIVKWPAGATIKFLLVSIFGFLVTLVLVYLLRKSKRLRKII